MQTINGKYIYEFSKANEPAASVKLGETFTVKTVDCYGGHLQSEGDLRSDFPDLKINPATGPIHIENVKRGDVIAVSIKKIELDSYGVMATSPGVGLLGDYITESQTRILPVENGKALLNETIEIPVHKMIGVIGVAPKGDPVSSSTPGEHGGNMDTKNITEGSTLHLPIFHDGGLLALGDLHAAMGDGELDGTGIEIGGEVTADIRKKEHIRLNTPVVKTDMELMIIASAINFQDAVRKGMLEAVTLLKKEHDVAFSDAYRLVSAVGDLRVSQLVNPKVTVRVVLPKELIPTVFSEFG